MDKLLELGKKYLPTPIILFFAHLAFATFCSVIMVLNLIVDEDHWAVAFCLNNWTLYLEWIFACLLALLVTFAKFKENSDVVAAIITFFAFWATIYGIHVMPFFCYGTSKGGSIVRIIFRAVIDVPLCIIYFLWSKDEIMASLGK